MGSITDVVLLVLVVLRMGWHTFTPYPPTTPVAGRSGMAPPLPGLPDPGLGGKVCGPLGPTLATLIMLADR